MDEDVDKGKPDDSRSGVGSGHTPGETCKEHEEGQEVGKGWIRAMPSILGFWYRFSSVSQYSHAVLMGRIYASTGIISY